MRKFMPLALAMIGLTGCYGDGALPTAGPVVAEEIDLSAMTAAISRGDHDRIEAVIVEQGGEVLFEQYWRGRNAESRIDARSAGKSITALAVAAAIDEGAIDSVAIPAIDLIAGEVPLENDGPPKRAISIHDLLSMSSALECDDWYTKSPGNEERMYDTDNWTWFALGLPIDPNYRRNEQGQGRFSYCTAGVFLLGRAVEAATGIRFDHYVQSRLFDPLGISGAEWTTSPTGEIQSGGQLALRARDFWHIGRLVLDGGVHNQRQLISKEKLRTILTPRVSTRDGLSYGYLWWFKNFSLSDGTTRSAAMMRGNGGNMVALFPETDTVIVILATNYNKDDMAENSESLIRNHILPTLPEGTLARLYR